MHLWLLPSLWLWWHLLRNNTWVVIVAPDERVVVGRVRLRRLQKRRLGVVAVLMRLNRCTERSARGKCMCCRCTKTW